MLGTSVNAGLTQMPGSRQLAKSSPVAVDKSITYLIRNMNWVENTTEDVIQRTHVKVTSGNKS